VLDEGILPSQPVQVIVQICLRHNRRSCVVIPVHPTGQRRMANSGIVRDFMRRGGPLCGANLTASRRLSGVGLFAVPIGHLVFPQLVLATFPWPVHCRAVWAHGTTQCTQPAHQPI
jgi:hypothetical protein